MRIRQRPPAKRELLDPYLELHGAEDGLSVEQDVSNVDEAAETNGPVITQVANFKLEYGVSPTGGGCVTLVNSLNYQHILSTTKIINCRC